MKDQLRKRVRIAGVAAAAGAALLLCDGTARAYTLVTRDGHRIESTQKPDVKGTQVFVRLAPNNRLAVVQESQIDWERTNAANPAPQRLVVPADAQMVEGPPSAHPIEKRIVGDGQRKPEAGPAAPAPDPGTPGQAVAKAPPAPGPKSVHDQEAILALRKQHAEVAALLATTRAQLDAHEKELSGLQSRPSAFVADDNPVSRRVRELQDQIAAERQKIGMLETRLGDLRSQAVEHGGTID
jgi:hypothetical protein